MHVLIKFKNVKHFKNKIPLPLLLILGLTLLQNCANPKIRESIPRSEINQPYTLPEGMSLWQTQSMLSNATDNRRAQNLLRVFPFFWEQGIHERMTLIWSPMPTALRVSFLQTYAQELEKRGTLSHYVGAEVSLLGSPLFQFQEFNLTPFLKIQSQFRINERLALQILFSGQLELRRSAPSLHGVTYGKIALLCQITETFSLAPFISPGIEWGSPRTGYIFSPDQPTQSSVGSSIRTPVGMVTNWFALDQWKFSVDYLLFFFNYPAPFVAHDLTIGTQYYF